MRTALGTVLLSTSLSIGCGFDWSLPVEGGGGGDTEGGGGATGQGASTAQGASTGEGANQPTSSTSSVDPTQDCLTCAQEAQQDVCSEQSGQCMQTRGCVQMAECVSQCGLEQPCIEECSANSSDEAITVFNAVLACVLCDACPQQCEPSPEVCS